MRVHTITKTINHLLANKRVPHASLLIGKVGYGIIGAGLDLAQGILCANTVNGQPCGTCSSCVKVDKQIHPDLHFAFPVAKRADKKRADTTSKDYLQEWRELISENQFFGEKEWARKIDAAGKQLNINTTECNEIIKKLSLKAFEGENKVLIIYLAEYLAKEGNRLLKLIEEPTPNSYIILLAEDSSRILNTILSRCQSIQIPPFPDNIVIKHLTDEKNINSETATEIAFLSKGDFRIANNLTQAADHSMSIRLIDWFRQSYMMNQKPKEMVTWIDDFSNLDKSLQTSFIEYVLHFLREFHLLLMTNDSNVRMTTEEKNVALKLQKIIDLSKVEKLSQIMDNLYYHLERNANLKLEILATSMEIGKVLKQKVAV